jgi:hypothetical protein
MHGIDAAARMQTKEKVYYIIYICIWYTYVCHDAIYMHTCIIPYFLFYMHAELCLNIHPGHQQSLID